MRKLGAAVLLVGVVGCDDGVFVEVKAPAGVTEVELFVGLRECGTDEADPDRCDHLRPPDFQLAISGEVYIRDHDEPYRATVEDGSAWFRLGVEPLKVPRLIAVGFSEAQPMSAAVLFDLDIDATHKVIVDLGSAGTWAPSSPRDGTHVKLWADDRCVGLRTGDDVLFIVPETDNDCDEVPTPECDPLAYQLDQQTNLACVTEVREPGDDSGSCFIGTRACSETSDTLGDQCVPGTTVVPPSICLACVDKGAFCIENNLATAKPRVSCTFRGEAENTFAACPSTSLGSAPAQLIDPNGGFCLPSVLVGPLQYPFGMFTQQFGDPAISVRPFNEQTCGIAVEWHLLAPTANNLPPEPQTMLLRMMGNLGGRNVDVVLPMDVQFESGCAVKPSCTVIE